MGYIASAVVGIVDGEWGAPELGGSDKCADLHPHCVMELAPLR